MCIGSINYMSSGSMHSHAERGNEEGFDAADVCEWRGR